MFYGTPYLIISRRVLERIRPVESVSRIYLDSVAAFSVLFKLAFRKNDEKAKYSEKKNITRSL